MMIWEGEEGDEGIFGKGRGGMMMIWEGEASILLVKLGTHGDKTVHLKVSISYTYD